METNVQSFRIFSIQINSTELLQRIKYFPIKAAICFGSTSFLQTARINYMYYGSTSWRFITRWRNHIFCWNLLVCHFKKLVRSKIFWILVNSLIVFCEKFLPESLTLIVFASLAETGDKGIVSMKNPRSFWATLSNCS